MLRNRKLCYVTEQNPRIVTVYFLLSMSKINYICGCHCSECSNCGIMRCDTTYFGTELRAFVLCWGWRQQVLPRS
jgi:hypothetical protein